jgi:hypothetical protein
MTKLEKQIIIEKLEETKKVMLHYHKTGDRESHKNASEIYRTVCDLAESLGIEPNPTPKGE